MLKTLRVFLIGFIGVTLLTLLNITLRWRRIEQAANPELLATASGPKIVTFWHGQQLFMAFAARHALLSSSGVVRPRMCTLISGHSDGRIIAFITKLLGLDSVTGSSTRGGKESIQKLADKLKDGSHIAITPDGPKGPIYKSKKGAVVIASITGVPIWPSACAASSKWEFKSWDNMFLPKPFSKIGLTFGEPLFVPANLDDSGVALYMEELDQRLIECTRQANSAIAS